MNRQSAAKILMMKRSIRCLVFGVIGLLPVIGFPFAVAALWLSGCVRTQEKEFWNPGQPYRIWGVTCAAFGAVVWFAVLAFIVYNLATGYTQNGGGYRGDYE